MGDFHGKFPEKLKKRILKEKPDCILCTGDFGPSEEYRKTVFKHWEEIHRKPLSKIIGKTKYKQLLADRRNNAMKMILFLVNHSLKSIFLSRCNSFK